MSWVDIRRNIGDEMEILFMSMAEAALPEPLLAQTSTTANPAPEISPAQDAKAEYLKH